MEIMKIQFMKITFSVLFLFVITALAGLSVEAQEERCLVNDPTGTPLNVRSAPNGRITGKLRNGSVVQIENYTVDAVSGREWARISVKRKGKYVILGYVFREFITCVER
jgi:uncharacterized protein YgiM (DUF1202 family)